MSAERDRNSAPRCRPNRNPVDARELAFSVLDEYKRTDVFVTQLLDDRAKDTLLSGEERSSSSEWRFASEMIYGVVRRQATLNALLQPHVKRPRHKVEGGLWTLLQMGTYQLVFMASVPPHAAVHETVELAKRLGNPRWSGFLNGVLRAVSGNLTEEITDRPAANAVPIVDGRYRISGQAVFPDPRSDAGGYFARAFSFPSWLVQHWERRFDFEELCRLGFWFNLPAKPYLRVNALKATRDSLLGKLDAAAIAARPGELPESVLLNATVRVDRLPGFEEGWFVVQDESAMRAARLLAPQPGQTVLDLCAAPGIKTTHLAELMCNQGSIIATDVQPERLARIEQNRRRLGIEIIETWLVDENGADLPAGPFDAILADVPCSNTGVLGKRPEARWRIHPHDLQKLAALQARLLSAACRRLKPGGRIVYSTCSLEPDENQQVVRTVLRQHSEFQLLDEITHHPGQPADGGYQALLYRREQDTNKIIP